MEAHSHHHLLEQEHQYHDSDNTRSRTFRVSLSLLGTLLGGTLLLNSLIAELIPSIDKSQADLMAMVGAILLGTPIIWHAMTSLIKGHSHMDELVALAIIAAFAMGNYRVAGAVGFFMLLSELIETRTALGARASIESLIRITPTRAHLITEDGETEVEAHLLQPKQVIRVRPGDNIPADGKVINGQSIVNQATITGESLPVDKNVGDKVFAGTTNLTGAMEVEVATAGADTTLGKVQTLIMQAEQTKIPIMRIIDRYVKWYTPTILMVAGLIFAFTNITNAISALIIACPCALILATPTAMVAALSCAARLGILVKNVADLEAAGRLTAIIFDKTGTLTTGQLAVSKLTPVKGIDPAVMLTAAASVEQFSKHPAAKALVEVAKKARLNLVKPDDFHETAGRGVSATVKGKAVLVGRDSWLKEQGIDMSAVSSDEMTPPEGISLLYVAQDGKCVGWIGMEDRTRPEARSAIADLAQMGMKRLVMVTGDRLAVAKRVAAEMGCSEVKAECLPHEKLQLVHQLQQSGHRVAVIGDGVNDAPALAAGDLGVAMGAAGSDIAINSASIALMNNDLNRISFLIHLSRTTRKVVTQNLGFGILFIILGIIFSGQGWLTPIAAVLLHLVSSLVIVFNSARLVRLGEELPHYDGAAEAAPAEHIDTTDTGVLSAVPAV
ncbi:MAG: cadmium-translocating P-type ATPase [Sedimentisphaerales bacterium]|nr:cadmium-translocating P-type ATPase [Sedimentisphaerales bacterium]